MKKIILDIRQYTQPEYIHDYIARKMNFPDYYGKNLDALYDMLTDIKEETSIGLLVNRNEESELFIKKLILVFNQAACEKNNLSVIICDLGKDGFLY